ncbi:MAG: ATP-binding protein [Patescibacteria group bacterium]|nr:ATP-binding protein [Patescibacteria group bacterium]
MSSVKTKKFRSLLVTLTIVFLLLGLIIFLVSTGFEIYFNIESQGRMVNDQQHLIAQNAADAVKNFIENKFNLLETTVKIGNLSVIEKEEYKLILTKLIGFESSFRQLALLDAQGKELSTVSRLSSQLTPVIDEFKKQIGEDLFVQIDKGEKYISQVYIDPTTGEPMIIMATPVKNVLGDLKGTLIAELNLKFIWDLMDEIKIGKNGLAYVVDKQGDLIAFKDISRVLQNENLAHLKEVNEFIKKENSLNQDEAEILRGIDGNLAVTNHIGLNFPDWAIIVELPVSEAYSNTIRTIKLSGLLTILGIILITIISISLSKKITDPIIKLKNAANEISGGNLKMKINIESNNEIGELAKNFNQMTAELYSYTQNLEKKVAEKTFELKKEKENVERKVEERTRELKEEQARFLASVYSLSLGFVLFNKQHQIMLKNDAAKNILKLYGDDLNVEIITKTLENKVNIKKRAEECMEKGKTIELSEVEHGEFFIHLLFVPIVMIKDSNEVIGYVLLIEDVTRERKIDRAKSEFVSLASHQLRTPLAGIKWFIELLMKGKGGKMDKKALDYLQQIYISNERMIKLVRDLLDISRIETGKKFEINKQKIKIKDILESSLKETFSLAKKRKIKIIKNDLGDNFELWVDPDKLKQVLDNLITNAIKYNKENGNIEINCQKEKDKIIFSIKDNGVGIPKNQQKRIFEKFFRADNAIFKETDGNGLGLYIAKAIVEAHGGKIWFKSKENKGATFYFSLAI